MINFIGKREEELVAVCDRLHEWVESGLGELASECHVELCLTAYTSAILIGGFVVWESENSPCEPTFENCRDVFRERVGTLAALGAPLRAGEGE
jgi:hypothetical protein